VSQLLEHNLALPDDRDADIRVTLPNGQVIELQWRVEAPSLDIILPEILPVSVWGPDMSEAPRCEQAHSAYMADQLVVSLAPDTLYPKEGA
jgi:hypothetical protein